MTSHEIIEKCIDYNNTFVGLTKGLKTLMVLDEILMPLPIPEILKPLYPAKFILAKVSEHKVEEFKRFKEKCEEDRKKMEEIKKTAIPID